MSNELRSVSSSITTSDDLIGTDGFFDCFNSFFNRSISSLISSFLQTKYQINQVMILFFFIFTFLMMMYSVDHPHPHYHCQVQVLVSFLV